MSNNFMFSDQRKKINERGDISYWNLYNLLPSYKNNLSETIFSKNNIKKINIELFDTNNSSKKH